jgi:DNA helicase-2/ATP-dependent DNA helicase PcrA
MNFQDDFGDGLADDATRTMVKLEENYRSTSNILEVANYLIDTTPNASTRCCGPPGAKGKPSTLPGR